MNNLSLSKDSACEKALKVLDLDLVQIFALFLIKGVALISMNFSPCCYKMGIKLCTIKYS